MRAEAEIEFPFDPEVEALEADAERLEELTPQHTIGWAFDRFGDDLGIATGFGAEGVALLDMAVQVNPTPYVFFLDTGFLFPETYTLRERLEDRYGIRIKPIHPEATPETQERIFGPELWLHDPDACCGLRKIEPLTRALGDLRAWMTAIRRDQTSARASARAVEWDRRWGLVKINPLVGWTKHDVWNYILKHDLPYNPLHDAGYPSIGCTHCTRAVGNGESDRAGRWAGYEKTECGLHGGTSLVRLGVSAGDGIQR